MNEPCEDYLALELAEQIFTDVKFYVSGQVSEKAIELLRSGGAERMNYFSDYVTHLICGQDCEETDLSDATEIYEIPALVEKWIFMCARLKCLVNTKPFIYNPNKLFSGLVFCFSRVGKDRELLWAIITYHGGAVQLNLTRAVTHLVTTQTESDKYKRAVGFPDKIEVVSSDWVLESVRNKSLAQASLFHPKLIDYPVVIKRPDTTAITGFEPESVEKEEEAAPTADSTQALLDKLKQRMPWNQPAEPPPNVVAPSFTGQKSVQEQRIFSPTSQSSQFNPVLGSPNQVPRSVVHHTPQPNQQQQPQQQQFLQQGNFPNNNPNFTKILEQLQRPNVQTINRIGQHNFIQKPNQQMINMQTQQGIVQRQIIKQLPGGQQIIQQQQQNPTQNPQQQQQQLVNRQILGNQQLLQGQKMQQLGQRILVGQQQNIALQKQQLLQSQQQLGLDQQIVSSVQQQPNQNIIHQSGGVNQGQIVQQHLNPTSVQQQIVQNQLINQQQPQQLLQNQQQQQIVQSQQQQQQIVPSSQHQQQQIIQNQQSQQQMLQNIQNQPQQIIQNQPPQQLIQNQPQQIVQSQQQLLQSQQQQQLQNQMITQQNPNIIQSPQHQQLQSPQRQQLQSPQHQQLQNQQILQQQNMLNQSQNILNQQNQNVLINQQQLHNQLINTSSQQTNVINHQHINSQQNLLNALQQQQQNQQHLISQQQQQQNIVQQQNVVIQQQSLVQQQSIITQQQQQQPNILQQQSNILQQQQQPNILQQQQQQGIVQQQSIVQQSIHQQTIITQQQQQNLLSQQNQNLINQQGNIPGSQQNILNINQQQLVSGSNQNQGFNNVNIPPNKVVQNQFGQQVIVQNQGQILSSNQQNPQQQQQFVNTSSNQNYQQQQTQFIQNQNQYNNQQQQQQQQSGQQMPQLVQSGQIQQNQFVQQNPNQQQGGNLQIINQQQILNQQQQLQKQPPHIMGNQQNQQFQPGQNPQQRPALWQQIRHPNGVNIVQQQGARVQWTGGGNQQQPPVQRQFIHLDAQTHQQLQQMAPEERALFVQKLQKHRLILQRQQIMQQQRSGHILIRSNGPVPQGLTPQQHMQWLQQQAKQQGIVLQQNIQPPPTPTPQPQQQQQPPPPAPTPNAAQPMQQQQHTPGLSPIQQPQPQQAPFNEQNLQQQRQQLRLHQLQLQREQAQKGVPGLAQAAPGQLPVRPQGIDPGSAVIDNQQVNAKTKTALANMLSIRLQSGNTTIGPGGETIAEPSAAGTLRMMTQRNAALNSNNRPDLLALQQQSRVINPPNTDVIRPPAPAQVQQNPPPDLPKPQYSPRSVLPIQHRPGTFYGHNPNLKLPPDLFLLGCIFVVVELERFLEESMPGWQKKIEKYGGEIEKQYCSRVTHVLCETQRHGVVMQALRDCKRCVTLYWLSDVMNRKQVLPPWTALHLPTMYLDTVPASKHLISLTGFSGTERERVKHMIKYIGASLTTYFSKHNTLLIATKPEGPKYTHAKRWGVPVVNIQWLTEVMLGNFSALNQLENVKYQQFNTPVNFCFDPALVPNLMHAWKMPINISQESYKRVKRSVSPGAMPQKVKKMKVEHVTDENENVENLPKSSTHRILFSRCSDIKELKEIVIQLGGSVVKHPSEATHLVLSQLLRTTKLLHSVCLPTKIVSEYWLRDSATAKTFLDENNYTLDTKEFNSKYKCDFAQTLTLKNRSKLLEGKFFFITPSVFPSKKTLTEIIQACGGVVERTRRTISQIEATNVNSPYSYIILTHEKDLHLVADLLKNKKDKIRIVCNVELILSAVLRQTFDVEPYVVKVV